MPKQMKIAIGSDHAAIERRNELITVMENWGYEVTDCGPFESFSVDYPDYAKLVCDQVSQGNADRGVLLCGTGIGMSIAANKCKGIRCALCSEGFSARLTREHNDSNVLAMGARTLGSELSIDILRIWLTTDFDGAERNARRIGKVRTLEIE